MIRADRTSQVLAALAKRISAQGDMPIRISTHTMRVLMSGVGLGQWEWSHDGFREIDAVALDALRHLAWLRLS
jgi:hypothetical protein